MYLSMLLIVLSLSCINPAGPDYPTIEDISLSNTAVHVVQQDALYWQGLITNKAGGEAFVIVRITIDNGKKRFVTERRVHVPGRGQHDFIHREARWKIMNVKMFFMSIHLEG